MHGALDAVRGVLRIAALSSTSPPKVRLAEQLAQLGEISELSARVDVVGEVVGRVAELLDTLTGGDDRLRHLRRGSGDRQRYDADTDQKRQSRLHPPAPPATRYP